MGSVLDALRKANVILVFNKKVANMIQSNIDLCHWPAFVTKPGACTIIDNINTRLPFNPFSRGPKKIRLPFYS